MCEVLSHWGPLSAALLHASSRGATSRSPKTQPVAVGRRRRTLQHTGFLYNLGSTIKACDSVVQVFDKRWDKSLKGKRFSSWLTGIEAKFFFIYQLLSNFAVKQMWQENVGLSKCKTECNVFWRDPDVKHAFQKFQTVIFFVLHVFAI